MLPTVVYATVRDSIDDAGRDCVDIECRFSDGQKYAAIQLADDEIGNDLAQKICGWLNAGRPAPLTQEQR